MTGVRIAKQRRVLKELARGAAGVDADLYRIEVATILFEGRAAQMRRIRSDHIDGHERVFNESLALELCVAPPMRPHRMALGAILPKQRCPGRRLLLVDRPKDVLGPFGGAERRNKFPMAIRPLISTVESNSPSCGVLDVRSSFAKTPMTSETFLVNGLAENPVHCTQDDCGAFHTNGIFCGASTGAQFSGTPICVII
jgi:hypothetical protein